MRIAVVVSTFPPYRGGMGNVAADDAALLAAAGHQVTVFTPRGAAPAGALFAVRRVSGLALGNAAWVPALAFFLRGFDAIHLHYPFFGGAEFVLLRKKLAAQQRLVLTYHMDAVGSLLTGPIFGLYRQLFLGPVLRAADRVLVSSLDYAQHSELAPFQKAIALKLQELPFPMPQSAMQPSAGRDEELPGRYFLFVGKLDRAHAFKGLDLLIPVFARMRDSLPEGYRLLIVGDGTRFQAYRQLAVQHGVQDVVDFLGAVPDGQKFNQLYRQARALVFPSRDRSEAFGLVQLYALAAGTPIIASDLPGVRSVATDAVALRVPPGDTAALAQALMAMAQDEALHARLSRGAKAAAERYDRGAYQRGLLLAFQG